MMGSRLLVGLCVLLSSGCAVLHKVQLSDIDASGKGQPISIKVSEDTVDFGELGAIAKGVGRNFKSKGAREVGGVFEAYTLFFQFGPRTGTPVFNELYARQVPEALAAACKKGYLSNVLSIRETRSYPVVKGEIVRIDALCM